MTVTYLNHPRGYTREAAVAIHLADGDAIGASATACRLPARNRMTTNTLERVTCRSCRGVIEKAED